VVPFLTVDDAVKWIGANAVGSVGFLFVAGDKVIRYKCFSVHKAWDELRKAQPPMDSEFV